MRRLIVCADGTWNSTDDTSDNKQAPTNVVKMQRAIKVLAADGTTTQTTYYHPGVGTRGGLLDHVTGGVTGAGIDQNILECYDFLINNYLEGDELYFFGFSRGAYTARSLAGLIRNSGLLRPEFVSMQSEAYSLYRDRDPAKGPTGVAAVKFRQAYSYEVDITCVGVWDTVGALGIPIELFKDLDAHRYAFHDVGLSSHVKNAFHAVAIDERRKPFAPTLWEQDADDVANKRNWLEQCWFAGVHSNVGGGYADAKLSDISFRWMVGRVQSRCPLEFDQVYVDSLQPDPLGKLYDSMNLFYQALGPNVRSIDDEAVSQRTDGKFTWEYVHQSVKDRMAAALRQSYDPDNLKAYDTRPDPKPIYADTLPVATDATAPAAAPTAGGKGKKPKG